MKRIIAKILLISSTGLTEQKGYTTHEIAKVYEVRKQILFFLKPPPKLMGFCFVLFTLLLELSFFYAWFKFQRVG